MGKRVAEQIVTGIAEFSEALTALAPVRPSHYHANGIEAIDVIEAFQLGFHLGNVVKYVLRDGRKSPITDLADLRKARWYLDREIERRCKSGVEKAVERIQNRKCAGETGDT